MTKAELLKEMQEDMEKIGITVSKSKVEQVIALYLGKVAMGIAKDGMFRQSGFGTWKLRKRPARTMRNPQTGQPLKVKASKTITFKPSTSWKESL